MGSGGKTTMREDGSGCNATIVLEIISCVIARNGKRLRKSLFLLGKLNARALRPYKWVTRIEPLDK